MAETDQKTQRVISEEERAEIKGAFDILDEDGDGKLSLDEMKTLLQSQFMTFSDSQAMEAIKAIDIDGSEAIEYSEFEKYVIDNNLSKPSAEEFGEEMRDAFRMFDTNDNGFIEADEFKAFMKNFGDKLTDEEIHEMMKEADTNGDGKIDYAEFCAHMCKSF